MLEGRFIIADATNSYDFDGDDPWEKVVAGLAPFGLAPPSILDLMHSSVRERRDLLVGKVVKNVLRIQAVELGLEPICSTVIHRIVTTNHLDGCWRQRADDGTIDTIETPARDISGALPTVVYHGTSEASLATILPQGLLIDRPPNWENGGRNHVYLAAEAQVSAFHARRTAQEHASTPVVLKCKMPTRWVADHDVEHQMVKNPLVPGDDGLFFAQEAGLFASPAPIPPADILEVRRPAFNSRYETWDIVGVPRETSRRVRDRSS
ncbi:hypothetical protein [Phenylobacterium sp.]|uniref:hypothetical protein n=1 Tax=Phenylobacterium sp. TaxID=1871053 RepID=UPI0035AF6C95